jgi:HAE1 family hydrophobic/amphiphilic exporter-1
VTLVDEAGSLEQRAHCGVAALGLGAGADVNGPMAIAVIGGMISSTLLTLGVVPAVYSLVDQGLQRLRARRG